MAYQTVQDSQGNWLRKSFMVPRTRLNLIAQRKQLFGEVAFKFTDTTLGGNFCINPPAQFTRYADLRVKGRNSKNQIYSNGEGQGRYYSEAIDDNSQWIHMRFGVPEFNSLTTFFTGFYNAEASLLARTGRAPGVFYTTAKLLGFVASVPLAPLIAVGTLYRFLAQTPASKFYYLKPTMPLYWNAVNTIVNTLAINMGMVPRVFSSEEKKMYENAGEPTGDISPTSADFQSIYNALPDIYYKNGGIDIYAVANRATRLAHIHRERMQTEMESATSNDDLSQRMSRYMSELISDPGTKGIDQLLQNYANAVSGNVNPANTGTEGPTSEPTGRGQPEGATVKKGWYDQLVDFGKAELFDGSAFVTFRVDHTGTASESFSSQTRESDLASKINSTSSSARTARFSFAEGNIGGGLIGSTIESVVGAAKDTVTGFLDGVQVSGIAALAGSAFVDMPKHWDSSSANLSTASYTIQLRSPYGNTLSRFQNLMVPLSMLLAGVLPLSTGPHSYNSPFLVELYSKGRNQTRLGIIDSMSITRGVGNMGWTKDGQPLGIDVTFQVADLSSIMHMPISPNFSLNPLQGVFDEDTAFNDYLSVLGSLSLSDQIYPGRKLQLNLTKKMVSFRQWSSPAKWANWANGTLPGRLVNAMAREIDRPG